MSELKFNVSTDKEHEIKLDSHLIYAAWRTGLAIAGQTAPLEVVTSFVGNGAKIKIKGKSEKGKKLGKINGKIRNNKYIGELEIPDDIDADDEVYFEVDLPQNSLDGESNRIPVRFVKVSNMKWSQSEARRADILTLSADVEGLGTGTEVNIAIYEYDSDGIHDRITEFPATVRDKKIEAKWEYEYHNSTQSIPSEDEIQKYSKKKHYAHPEYFFLLKIGGVEYGRDQESGILKFKDWIEISLTEDSGVPIPDEKYVLHMPDGSTRDGTLDANGWALEEDIPPGPVSVEFPDVEDISIPGAED